MYSTRTEHEAPLNLFCCCFMPIWAPTMVQRVQSPKQWLGLFSWGLPGKTGDFWPIIIGQKSPVKAYMGVRTTLWPQLEISPMDQPTIRTDQPYSSRYTDLHLTSA